MRKHSLVLSSFLFFPFDKGSEQGCWRDRDKNKRPDRGETAGGVRNALSCNSQWTLDSPNSIQRTAGAYSYSRHINKWSIKTKLLPTANNCIDTRQPWFLESFWDNEFLVPRSHPDTMKKKKVLADDECADHAECVFLSDCILNCRYQLLHLLFLIQWVHPHAGHAVCSSAPPPHFKLMGNKM